MKKDNSELTHALQKAIENVLEQEKISPLLALHNLVLVFNSFFGFLEENEQGDLVKKYIRSKSYNIDFITIIYLTMHLCSKILEKIKIEKEKYENNGEEK